MSVNRQPTSIPLELAPMEARLVDCLPTGSGWQFEPKWDGFRCLVHRRGREVVLVAKSGKRLGRFFPEVVEQLAALPQSHFVLDGELVIPAQGTLSFDALQMRLHPAASRIARLARETPAKVIAFDCLLRERDRPLLAAPFEQRRRELEFLLAALGSQTALSLTAFTRRRVTAQRWLSVGQSGRDGVVAKRLDLAYQPGSRAMTKVKRLRTADCVVGGFRY